MVQKPVPRPPLVACMQYMHDFVWKRSSDMPRICVGLKGLPRLACAYAIVWLSAQRSRLEKEVSRARNSDMRI